MSKKWGIVVGCFGLAAISMIALWCILHMMTHIPRGYSAAPNPTPEGIVQAAIAALSAAGFSLTGILVAAINLWHKYHQKTITNTDGTTTIVETPPSDSLDDLMIAFPAYMSDRSSKSKERRFWFDLFQVGIELEPDPDIQAWMLEGSELFRKKFFPPVPPEPVKPTT